MRCYGVRRAASGARGGPKKAYAQALLNNPEHKQRTVRDLCASEGVASRWANRLLDTVRMTWSADPSLRGFFKGTTNCLSALLEARRYDGILELLEHAPHRM